MSGFTTEQILAMAPDTGSAKAGQGLANPGKWAVLETSESAVWGACQGSGANPYQVMIDLSEPAFHCSCPSRKFPCKHGLGLLLIYSNNQAAFKTGTPTAAVAAWLAKRGEKAEKQSKQASEAPKTETELAKAAEDQAKRVAQRQKKVTQGLADLRTWLRDLVRQGISQVQSRPYKFWDEPAGRLVDAQAPGVARMVRDMASVPASGEGWQERLVERIGCLTLLLEAFDRIDTLPEAVQADVREAIGWNVRQETVLAGEVISDFWSVLGQRSYDEEQLRVTRTWMRGRDTGRDALSVQFTRPGQPLEMVFTPGSEFGADLAFFPGAWPLRALVKQRTSSATNANANAAYSGFTRLLDRFSDAVALSPWLPVFPASLESVVLVVSGDAWSLQDQAGHRLPLSSQFQQGWKLLGISGGHPIHLFAEWDGAALHPLSVWAGNRLITLA